MPKLTAIPRLSIVAPVTADSARFETSLVSILENRPAGCEVIVPHDGSYDDPFDLGDEVSFLTTDSSNLVDLVHEASRKARGRFVHVLCDGVCATDGWADAALDKFEHSDAGVVVPVLRDQEGYIVAAGWHDSATRLCCPTDDGQQQLGRHSPTRIGGGYLQASFWQRDLLRSMVHSYTGTDTIEASYAYSHLARQGGWRVILASESEVCQEAESIVWDSTSLSRGKRLRAIKSAEAGVTWGQALAASGRAMLSNILTPAGIAEAIGQAFAPTVAAEIRKRWRFEEVARNDESRNVLSLPSNSGRRETRRAA